MNYLNKKLRNKILTQMLMGTSILGVMVGSYYIEQNLNVNALEESASSSIKSIKQCMGNTFILKDDGSAMAVGQNNY